MEDPADVAFDPITIVLADDHALVRGGLHRILEAEDDFRVGAEAGDADEALRITREVRPRIVLLDVTCGRTFTSRHRHYRTCAPSFRPR